MDEELYEKYKVDYEKIKPLILDTIVEVYGEKHRKQLTESVDKVYVNTYIDEEGIRNLILEKEQEKRVELTIAFLERMGEEITEEQKRQIRKEGTSKLTEEQKNKMAFYFEESSHSPHFDERENLPIYSLKNGWEKDRNIGDLLSKCLFLRKFGLNIHPGNYEEVVKDPENKEKLEKAKKIANIASSLQEEFGTLKEELKLEKKFLDTCEKKKVEIRNECKGEYLEEVKGLFFSNPTLLEICQKAMGVNSKEEYFEKLEENNVLLEADGYTYPKRLNAFSMNAQRILEEGTEKEQIEYIKQDQEEVCTLLGGKTSKEKEKIQSILKDWILYEYTSSHHSVIFTNQIKEKEQKQMSSYKQDEKDFEKFVETRGIDASNLDLSDLMNQYSNRNISPWSYASGRTAPKEKSIEAITFVQFDILSLPDGIRDIVLIHEILHGMETTLSIYLNNLIMKTGFCIEGMKTKDDYEQLSEGIHQMITIEVVKKLHEKGMYLLDTPENARYDNITYYEKFFPFLQYFFEQNRQDILDARLAPNLDLFLDKVGKENLDGMASTINQVKSLIIQEKKQEVVKDRYKEEEHNALMYTAAIREKVERYQAEKNIASVR